MVGYEDILNFEIMRFKQDYSISNYNEKDAIRLLRVALADALVYAARREKVKYADNANEICEKMSKIISIENMSNKAFKNIFNLLVEEFKNNKYLTKFNKSGYAFKFASMAFKYFYCFDDIREKYDDKFDECYLPLDSNTLKWCENMFNEKYSVWSELKEEEYALIQIKIQDAISKELQYTYKMIDINKKSIVPIKCSPKNRLHLEFIMWNQEKNNNQ